MYDIKNSVDFYKDSLSWPEIIEVAKSWHACNPLYYVLYFTKEILDLNFPDSVLRQIRPKHISRTDRKIVSSILKHKAGSHNLVYPLYLSMLQNLFQKVKFVILSLFPPPGQLSRIYSVKRRYLLFFYYFKRFAWALTQITRFLGKA